MPGMSRKTPTASSLWKCPPKPALVAVACDPEHHPVPVRALREELQRRRLSAELILRVVEVRQVLDLRDRQEAAHRGAEREPEDRRLVEQRVEHATRPEASVKSARHAVDTALHRDVLPEQQRVRVALEQGSQPGVDPLSERERLAVGKVDTPRLLGHDRRRARRERGHDLLRGGHLRERGDFECELPRLVAGGEVIVRELRPARSPGRHEPACGSEDRVAVVVGPHRLRRPVRHLGVRARVTEVAHRPQVQDRRPAPLADPGGELRGDPEHLGRIVPVRHLVAQLGPRRERRLDPTRRRRNADAETVVLADEEKWHRKTLERALSGGVEGGLRGRVVQ